jgi:tyrosyl-tRNA synthetase
MIRAAFGGPGGDKSGLPQKILEKARFETGYNVVDLFADAGLVPTKSEGRRLVQQGGAFVSSPADAALHALSDVNSVIGTDQFSEQGELILRAGKKRYCLVTTK